MLTEYVWDAAFTSSIAAIVVGAIGVMVSRKAFYMLLGLITAALGVASIIALIGYTYLSVFHVIVYIGTAVALLAIVILLLGHHVEPVQWDTRRLVIAAIAASLLQAPVYVYVRMASPGLRTSIGEISRQLYSCWYCTLLIVVTLATAVIEAIAIARHPAVKRSSAVGDS